MNDSIECNYKKLNARLFILPIVLAGLLVLMLYTQQALNFAGYIQFQKKYFYFLNAHLSQFPVLEYNLTQLGDAFIFLSLLSVLILYAPSIWETLIPASLISALLSSALKAFFSLPRPAAVLNQDTYVIIGKVLSGSTNSMPSGHSVTVFTVLTVIMFGIMPQKNILKVGAFIVFVCAGLFVAMTRVGVGAHFPLDVIVGCIVGYISALLGIFTNRKFNVWSWMREKRYCPFFITVFSIAFGVVVFKIIHENLLIYYFALVSLLTSVYLLFKKYVQK
ncbi:MAG: phosphatase PAP2 family protein [Sphingobacteriaceae bacterium]|nr:phosphatase PAP2 family protein [Sphingobacteriaceae bacterium]